MTIITSTPHSCLSCGHKLTVDFTAGVYSVWCGNGPCQSFAGDEGDEGETIEEAVDKLHKAQAEEGKQ